MKQEIIKTPNGYGYNYRMESTNGFGPVGIEVNSVDGCLLGISLPIFVVEGFAIADGIIPVMSDVMHVLNRILEDYHCSMSVVRGKIEIV
jgi:hypothetical protein